jgi:hypothetical protein
MTTRKQGSSEFPMHPLEDDRQIEMFEADNRSEADTEVLGELSDLRLDEVATLLEADRQLHYVRVERGVQPPSAYHLTGTRLRIALESHGLHIQVEEAR